MGKWTEKVSISYGIKWKQWFTLSRNFTLAKEDVQNIELAVDMRTKIIIAVETKMVGATSRDEKKTDS